MNLFNFINLFKVFLLFFVTTGNTGVLKNTINDYPQNLVLSDPADRIIKIETPSNFIDFILLAIEDLNNDGFDDLIFRAAQDDSTTSFYIIYGKTEFEKGFNIDDPDIEKTVIYLEHVFHSEVRIIRTGDLNRDGFKDIIFNISRTLHIIWGKEELKNQEITIDIQTETTKISTQCTFLNKNSILITDFNNDGCDDIIITEVSFVYVSIYSPIKKGFLYIIPGNYSFPTYIDLENPPIPILKIIGENPITLECFRQIICGDFNGDHENDLLIYGGSNSNLRIMPYYDMFYIINNPIFSYLINSGGEITIDPQNKNFIRLVRYTQYLENSREHEGRVRGADLLSHIISVGDINGDGFDDCIFAYPKIVNTHTEWPWLDDYSEIYVVLGKHDNIENGDLDKISSGMIKFKSAYINDVMGINFTTSDINGDGFDDLVLENVYNSMYIIFGRSHFPDTTIISDKSPFTSFIKGDKKSLDDLDFAGRKEIPIGDINGDGYNDIGLKRKNGIYILLGEGNKYELKQTIVHPLPGATKSRVTFGFLDGTKFQFRFTKGKPAKDSELHLTQFGRTLPDSLKHIPTSSGVVSFIDADITGLSTEYQTECSIGYTDSLVNILGIREGDLSISYWNEEQSQWIKISSQINTDRNSVTFLTDHFSLFALVDKNDPVLSVGDQDNKLPLSFQLEQNYPNPFNPTTIIRFQTPQAGITSIRIYNILGQEVKTVINEQLSAGIHEVNWDGTDKFGNKVASGIYIYRMETNTGYVRTRKMVFLK